MCQITRRGALILQELNLAFLKVSLLGPLVFNIFINDLNFCVLDVSLRLYADDTRLPTSLMYLPPF